MISRTRKGARKIWRAIKPRHSVMRPDWPTNRHAPRPIRPSRRAGGACAEPRAPMRARPDFAGCGPAGRDAADAVTLVPRLLLSPLFVTDEYLLRRPLAVAVPAAERRDVPRRLYDV